jgi:hypothetical protein
MNPSNLPIPFHFLVEHAWYGLVLYFTIYFAFHITGALKQWFKP